MYPRVDIDQATRARWSESMTQPPPTLRRWTRVEYERLFDLGRFESR